MLIKTLVVGPIEENCYVVTNESTLECVVIDPGDESNTILDYIEDNRLKCAAIMITHGHFDHVGAVEAVAEETGAVIYMSPLDCRSAMNSDEFPYDLPEGGIELNDGDIISAAGLTFEIIATPGHSRGSVTIKCEDALFTGDTMFRGSSGRTDLEGGNQVSMMKSLAKLCRLEGDYEVYPGHMESSSLLRERTFNYYCREAMKSY